MSLTAPTGEVKTRIEGNHPLLKGTDWKIIGGKTNKYNCLVWAWGRTNEAFRSLDYFPPKGKEGVNYLGVDGWESLDAYMKAEGFEHTTDKNQSDLDVWYATKNEAGAMETRVTHFSRPYEFGKRTGKWSSKLGDDECITHDRDAIANADYGTVQRYYTKPAHAHTLLAMEPSKPTEPHHEALIAKVQPKAPAAHVPASAPNTHTPATTHNPTPATHNTPTTKPPVAHPPTAHPPTANPPTTHPPTAKPPTAHPPTTQPGKGTQPTHPGAQPDAQLTAAFEKAFNALKAALHKSPLSEQSSPFPMLATKEYQALKALGPNITPLLVGELKKTEDNDFVIPILQQMHAKVTIPHGSASQQRAAIIKAFK